MIDKYRYRNTFERCKYSDKDPEREEQWNVIHAGA